MAATAKMSLDFLYMTIVLCLMLQVAAAQQGSCPVTNRQKYNDIVPNDKLNSAWFQAASTPPLAQAAYAFDVPRVRCLLAAEADVNQRVQNSLTGVGANQWALGAAVAHLNSYTDSGVTPEMVETVQLLLKAGANPNIRFNEPTSNTTPLDTVVDVVGRCRSPCPGQSARTATGCCPTEQAMVNVIKALVASGANTRTALDTGILNRANVGTRYCDPKDPGFTQVVDFLISKGSTVSGPVSGIGNEDCPKLQATLKRAAQKSG